MPLKQLPGFVQDRARSLATVYLTRRGDVIVREGLKEQGFDLVADIQRGDGSDERRLGIAVRGRTPADTPAHLNDILKAEVAALTQKTSFRGPAILLVFTMVDDQGYYTWLAEPIVEGNGHPDLEVRAHPAFMLLDASALNAIVDRVDDWYDARPGHTRLPKRRPMSSLAILDDIIDKQAEFVARHGKQPKTLRLPLLQAYDLAKLGREHLGDLSNEIMLKGIKVLERTGLMGMKVELDSDAQVLEVS